MEIDKYQRKNSSLVVEAVMLTEDNMSEVSNWAHGAQIIEEKDALTNDTTEALNLKTPYGKIRVYSGEMILKAADRFYSFSRRGFLKKYELITNEPLTPVNENVKNYAEGKIDKEVLDPFSNIRRAENPHA